MARGRARRPFEIGRVGFEPTVPRLKGGCLGPLGYRPAKSGKNCGGGIRTHEVAALTERCLTSLATPHRRGRGGGNRTRLHGRGLWGRRAHQGTSPQKLAAAAGLEPAHTRLQDERSVYPFELRRKDGLGGIRTLTRSLQDFYAAFTSPARVWGAGRREGRRRSISRPAPRNCGGGI